MNKKKRLAIIIPLIVVTTLALVVLIPFMILGIRTSSINKSYQYLKEDDRYSQKEEVLGIELVTQHISCGYATIEMMSSYYGNKMENGIKL